MGVFHACSQIFYCFDLVTSLYSMYRTSKLLNVVKMNTISHSVSHKRLSKQNTTLLCRGSISFCRLLKSNPQKLWRIYRKKKSRTLSLPSSTRYGNTSQESEMHHVAILLKPPALPRLRSISLSTG